MKKIIALLMMTALTLFSATENELERAYAKEFAYLKAQKKMLTKHLADMEAEQQQKISAAKAELGTLQNVVLKKNAQSEKLSDDLYRAQQSAQIMTDDTSLIEAVMMQSTTALKPYGIEINVDPNNYQEALKNVFAETERLIKELSSVRIEDGKFYVADGSEKEAKLVKIGHIATYGVASDAAGALAPAGAGKLKLWNAPAVADAEAMASGQRLDQLNIFIYENAAKEVEDLEEKSAMDVIDSGGIIGWVIVALGVIALIFSGMRAVFLSSADSKANTLPKETLEKLLNEGKEAALEFLKPKKNATSRVLKSTIRNLDRDREHIEDIVAESILHESGRLDRFGTAIIVIAAVAPLLGLLGTVTGMIATFDIITEFGTGDPKLLSGGISIALVTTELGLIVAIPAIMLGNLLSGWAERVKDHMEHSALHLINEYNKQR